MASQSDYINKLRSDVSDAEKQLQALLEKREMYKSLIVKLDAEERSLSKKLQDTKAKFRELSGDATPAAPKSLAASGVVQDVSSFEPLANSIPVGVYARECSSSGDAQTLAGPQTEDVYFISDVIAARTVSTYPLVPGGTKRVCFLHIATFFFCLFVSLFLSLFLLYSKGPLFAISTSFRHSQSGCLYASQMVATGVSALVKLLVLRQSALSRTQWSTLSLRTICENAAKCFFLP